MSATAKLSATQVAQIRQLAADGVPTKTLAVSYGVSKQAISNIRTRKSWKGPRQPVDKIRCPGSLKPVRRDPFGKANCPSCNGFYVARREGKMRVHYLEARDTP